MNKATEVFAAASLITIFAVSPNDALAGKNDQKNRAFKGKANGMVVDPVPPSAPDEPTLLIIEYTGTATHLGRYTRAEYLFLNPDGVTFSGFMFFTAANGGKLDFDSAGMFNSPKDVAGSYEFTGGTGRFADARGRAPFAGFTPDGINVRVRFQGKIRY